MLTFIGQMIVSAIQFSQLKLHCPLSKHATIHPPIPPQSMLRLLTARTLAFPIQHPSERKTGYTFQKNIALHIK